MTAMKFPPSAQAYDPSLSLPDWMEENRKRFGDIYQATIYGSRAYVVCSAEYVEHVLRRNWRGYKKGSAITKVELLLGKGLMVSEGRLWKVQRRMIHPAFHRGFLAGLNNVIVRANTSLVERWERAAANSETVNVTSDVSRLVLEVTLRTIFGEDYEPYAANFRFISEDPTRDLRFVCVFKALRSLIIQIVAERRLRHAPFPADILSVLLEARDPGGQPMTDGQLVNEVLTLIVAGHETTASTLTWMWYLLSQHPEADDKLRNELSAKAGVLNVADLAQCTYGRQVIEETLRLYPAGWLITRRALMDDQIGDFLTPVGTEVYLPIYILQRHPDLWSEPNRFNPDRFGPGHPADRHSLAMLPFSAGPRNCIGEFLARLELQTHLGMVARKLRLQYSGVAPLELEFGVNLRNKFDFIMKPIALGIGGVCSGA